MKVHVADTRIDFDRMVAQHGGTERNLTRQTAGILRALCDAKGEVVSKEDLVDSVWNGRVITDATLSTAIREARRVVGDSGNEQRIIETVHGVGFRLRATTKAAPENAGAARVQPCLIVLPFRNTSPDRESQFIAEGLTDEVISALSRFRDLKTLSRATSDAALAAKLDTADVQRRYGADFVIEGSVRRTETRLKVSLQLVAADTGSVLITEQFNRDATVASLFDVQDQIAELCAGRIAGPHGPLAKEAAEAQYPSASHASWTMVRLVADFRRYYRSYDVQLHEELRNTLPVALESHPEAADGWAALSVILLEEFRYHVNERPELDVLSMATQAAQKAVAADPRNAFAQTALAMCCLYSMDMAGFDMAAKKAVALNPNNSDVLSEIGHCYAFLGREEDAIAMLDKAIDLSPEHPGWYHFAKTWRYVRLGMVEAALLEIQKFPMPGFYWYHAHLVWLFAALGRMDEAHTEVTALLEVFPDFETRVMEELGMWDANRDLVASAQDHWSRAGLQIS